MKQLIFASIVLLLIGCVSRDIIEIPITTTVVPQKVAIEKLEVERSSEGIIIHGKLQNKTYSYISPLEIKTMIKDPDNGNLDEKLVEVSMPFRRLVGKKRRSWNRSYKYFAIPMPFHPEMQKISIVVNYALADNISDREK